MIFAFAPYRRAIRSFCDRIGFIDRFIRLHYFGFTSMLALLGAGLVRAKPEKGTVGGLLRLMNMEIESFLISCRD